MKRLLTAFLALSFFACTTGTISPTASLIGTHDIVFVDQLGDEGTVAALANDGDGNLTVKGLPSRFMFITSADTNELRIWELYRTGRVAESWLPGPNPLETLSIPVLERPTMLATGEGRNAQGQRVTGQYVFAARPGGAEVSLVSLAYRRQLGGRPLATPAPVIAIAGSLAVGADQKMGASTLYVATWDGSASGVFSVTLDPSDEVVDTAVRAGTLKFTRVTTIEGEPLSALQVIAAVPTRTVDGVPFCATEACLALSTRPGIGRGGEAFLFEPSTSRSVKLAFPGPVRKFATGAYTRRLYALLDESPCGGPQCGGVVAVDLLGATGNTFAESRDVVGRPFGPLRLTSGLMTGLGIAQSATVRQVTESADDAGTASYLMQQYDELGVFATSDGLLTYFSGSAGSVIDYDGRRSRVIAAAIRAPGLLADGGYSFATADGGVNGSVVASTTIDTPLPASETWRVSTVGFTGEFESSWRVDVSDGYFVGQDFLVINQGQLPGLVGLTTTAADGNRVGTGGFEVRAEVGDIVAFEATDVIGLECGRAKVTSSGTGYLEVDAIPAECAARQRFNVRAGAVKPWVIVGGSEGYMGRATPGTQFTYSRALALIPGDVIADRTAITIDLPTNGLVGEGAYVDFTLQSFLVPLRVQLDTASGTINACASALPQQVVFGNTQLVFAPFNPSSQSEVTFVWRTASVVPSANGFAWLTNESLEPGRAMSTIDGVRCYR